jgi:hypothetical protein
VETVLAENKNFGKQFTNLSVFGLRAITRCLFYTKPFGIIKRCGKSTRKALYIDAHHHILLESINDNVAMPMSFWYKSKMINICSVMARCRDLGSAAAAQIPFDLCGCNPPGSCWKSAANLLEQECDCEHICRENVIF